VIAGVTAVAGAVATAVIGSRFRHPERVMRRANGRGIVSLEVARGPAKAREIVTTWGDDGVAAARESVRLDWAFIPSYVVLGASLAALLDAPVAAGVMVVAGGCDLVENIGLGRVLDSRYESQWLTFGASVTKWTLLAVAPILALLRS